VRLFAENRNPASVGSATLGEPTEEQSDTGRRLVLNGKVSSRLSALKYKEARRPEEFF